MRAYQNRTLLPRVSEMRALGLDIKCIRGEERLAEVVRLWCAIREHQSNGAFSIERPRDFRTKQAVQR